MCWIAATNWKIIDIEHDFIGARLGKLRAMEAQTHGMSIAKMSTGIRKPPSGIYRNNEAE